MNFFLFEAGGAHYAVEASFVRQVAAWTEPLPAPWGADVLGVVPVEGRLVLVLAERAFGAPISRRSRVLVLESSEGDLGLPIGSSTGLAEETGDAQVVDLEAITAALLAG